MHGTRTIWCATSWSLTLLLQPWCQLDDYLQRICKRPGAEGALAQQLRRAAQARPPGGRVDAH